METVKNYPAPPFDRREILRYAGVRSALPEMETLLDQCLSEVSPQLCYRVCFTRVPVTREGEVLSLGFLKTASESLKKHLQGCDKAVVFGATVGVGLDRLITKYSAVAPSKALMLQAIGAERIEALCDAFEKDVPDKATSRFSPGYGDLPLSLQKDIFLLLSCEKKIGLTLNGSMLMSPSKSVTAIIGIR